MKRLITKPLALVLILVCLELAAQNNEQNLGLRLGYSFQLGGNYGKMTDYYNGSIAFGFTGQDEIVKPTFASGINLGLAYDYFFDKIGFGVDLGFLQGSEFEEEQQIINTAGEGYQINRYDNSRFYRLAPSLLIRSASRMNQDYLYMGVGPIINAGSFERFYESEGLSQDDRYVARYSTFLNFGFTSTLSYRKRLNENFAVDFGIRYEHLNFVPKKREYLEFYRDGEKLELTEFRRVTIYVDEVSEGEVDTSEPGEAVKISFPLSNISFFIRANLSL